ncbi:MAG: helix-turn-helix protein [Akkermansiaceae bacterium]|nr:helix-turn-helix protein [Akkermansiaceae bacterium]
MRLSFVSVPETVRINRGCYDLPHSGVGIEFSPLGAPMDEGRLLLHETGFLERNQRWVFPNTVSPFWRLYYNFAPGHIVRFPNREIPLEPGRLVLIPDHQVFDSHGVVPVPHFWMTFSLGIMPRRAEPLVLDIRPEELALVERIRSRFTGVAAGSRFPILHESCALLHLIIARPDVAWDDRPRSPASTRIAAYISSHFHESLEIPALAKLAGVSTRTLSTLFQRDYRVAPSKFIARVRTREAANLLVTTELSMEEIAERAGFPNRYYMTRIFTRITGKPPAKFRRENRPAEDLP